MKASLENLYHFNCNACDRWWSIGDFPWGSQTKMWCPWCGHENELPETPTSGDDFLQAFKKDVLLETRSELIGKKLAAGLSPEDENLLAHINGCLDQIEVEQITPYFEQVEREIEAKKELGREISSLVHAIEFNQNIPTPGQIYWHRWHDVETGKWHEYQVVGVVEPRSEATGNIPRSHFYFPGPYRHTSTGNALVLIGCGPKIYTDDIIEPHIAYKNTRPDLCDPKWVYCLRPLEEFMDGRFMLVG